MEDPQHKRHVCGCATCRNRIDPAMVEYHAAINRVLAELNERDRRLLAGLLAQRLGHGGIQRITEITGLSRKTIQRGCREMAARRLRTVGRIRRRGGGRKRVEKKHQRS